MRKCENYQKEKCKGCLHVSNYKVVNETDHNHVPDSAKIEVIKAINELKKGN